MIIMDEREEYTITFFNETAEEHTFDLHMLKLEVAEDLVITCCRRVGIGPVARHLFALYHKPTKSWLAPNQTLINREWPESRKLEVMIIIHIHYVSYLFQTV